MSSWENQNLNESLNSVIWLRILKTASVKNDTVNFGLYDEVLCCNDGVRKKNYVLNILDECGSETVISV
jgi:hypothetical protein